MSPCTTESIHRSSESFHCSTSIVLYSMFKILYLSFDTRDESFYEER